MTAFNNNQEISFRPTQDANSYNTSENNDFEQQCNPSPDDNFHKFFGSQSNPESNCDGDNTYNLRRYNQKHVENYVNPNANLDLGIHGSANPISVHENGKMTSKCVCLDTDFVPPYYHNKLFDTCSDVNLISADTTILSSFEPPSEKLNHELALLEPKLLEICENTRNNSTISQGQLELDIHGNFASQEETVEMGPSSKSSTKSGKCECENISRNKALWTSSTSTRPYSSASIKNPNPSVYETTTTYQPFYKSSWVRRSTRALCTHEPLQESNNKNREYSDNPEIRSYNETNGNGKHITTDHFYQLPGFEKSLNKSKSKSVGIPNTAWHSGNYYEDDCNVYDETKGTHFQNGTCSLYKSAVTNTESRACTFFSQPSTADENKENAGLTDYRFPNSKNQLFNGYGLNNEDETSFTTERKVDNYDFKRSLYHATDSSAFVQFMKAVPLTGDFDIDEEIFKFYRSQFSGSQYVVNELQ